MSRCLSARARQRICFVCECLCGRAREFRSFVARPCAVTPDVRSLAGLWTGGFSFCWSHDRCFSQADVQLCCLSRFNLPSVPGLWRAPGRDLRTLSACSLVCPHLEPRFTISQLCLLVGGQAQHLTARSRCYMLSCVFNLPSFVRCFRDRLGRPQGAPRGVCST